MQREKYLQYSDWFKAQLKEGIRLRLSKRNLTKQSPEALKKRVEKVHYYLMNIYAIYFTFNIGIGEAHIKNYIELKIE